MWQGLDIFLAVVEHGSFSRAAQALDVSTSHVSRQIQQLEQRLGTLLLQRTTRSINLTDAGKHYAAKLKLIQQELSEANDQLLGGQQIPKGHIRITGAGDFVANSVAPVIAEFCLQYPEVTIEIDFNNRNVDLVEDGFDLAIRFGRMRDSSLIARKLTPRPMTLVASPNYLNQHPAPTHPHQLSQHNCLLAANNRWRFAIDHNIEEVKVSGNWRTNHPHALLQACLQGLGISHLARDIVEPHLASGALLTLLDEFQVTDNASWLVYPRKDLMPYRVRLLIDFLLDRFDTSID
ncbi:LysR family transcriptional regulator [Pseudoalteromonas rubra]|uniref:LysR family transcriptional regulator n=1 Tax=Pseudoalteromonas rubra TaxID=43658 RepID=A0A5S3WID9_9GAMM|nr:LysR family transcriptional regulator [Pseudoalteromonas rubra]TMP26162.1 LysR family transcriptional regulator [Pseudoalteromonas rubra]TMP32965.1 LysR family transcriptional regulator [Pseudoalteromonas rubra]